MTKLTENMREYKQKWYQKNKEKVKERTKSWEEFNKEKYRVYHRKAQKKYCTNNPKKVKAHRIAKGLRGRKCERCGITNVRLEGHHFDYSLPNKIITLCIKCHKKIHRK